MGGGDLNMKKSWHPLLLKNQERVWLEEKKALEEKKKLDQLRKELEEERQLQELQRLQEEQTGKKRSETLEWMYATPASGSGQNANELEEYLLGKKRVDKMLTGDENAKVGAAHKNFIAVQNANNARDTAAKVREDPLFAIKQQEQAAYQSLLSNPLRFKELQQRNGMEVTKKDKKRDKQARREAKEERRRLKILAKEQTMSPGRIRGRSQTRSTSPPRYRYSRSPDHSRRQRRSRSRSPLRRYTDTDTLFNRLRNPRMSPGLLHHRSRSHTPSRDHDYLDRKRKRSVNSSRSRSPPSSLDRRAAKMPYRSRTPGADRLANGSTQVPSRETHSQFPHVSRLPPDPRPPVPTNGSLETDRAARLAAMSSSAHELTSERRQRLEMMLIQEKEEQEREEKERQRHAKTGGVGGFLDGERRKVYAGGMEGGLAERIRRGRGAMVGVD
ncbi:hypothetical protein K439DRAFT_204702 [Ramaria rubella]|nr:hypothetical protein K439DRAFT_204702 [Ramaria rubella]